MHADTSRTGTRAHTHTRARTHTHTHTHTHARARVRAQARARTHARTYAHTAGGDEMINIVNYIASIRGFEPRSLLHSECGPLRIVLHRN